MGSMEFTPNTIEREPQVIGKVTIMRHGETKYTDKFPDLTERGQSQARENGRHLKEKLTEADDVFYASSPSARARGTMSFVMEEIGEEEAEARVMDAIRSVRIHDMAKAREVVDEIIGEDRDPAKMDRAYANDPQFEDTPEVWEPKSSAEKRFYRGLEYVIRSFLKYQADNEGGLMPHVVAVSHFEPLNHFVMKVFGIDPKEGDLLGFAEMIEMDILEPNPEEPTLTPIRVSFRGESKDIVFNREDRSINVL